MPTGDDQKSAEAFDSDKLDDLRDRADQEQTFPPERLLGATDPTADEWAADSVTSRRDRLEPDPVERLGMDDAPRRPAGPGVVDAETTEEDAVAGLLAVAGDEPADGAVAPGPPAAVLVAPGADDDATAAPDDEAQALAVAVPAADLSAEEAAVQVEQA